MNTTILSICNAIVNSEIRFTKNDISTCLTETEKQEMRTKEEKHLFIKESACGYGLTKPTKNSGKKSADFIRGINLDGIHSKPALDLFWGKNDARIAQNELAKKSAHHETAEKPNYDFFSDTDSKAPLKDRIQKHNETVYGKDNTVYDFDAETVKKIDKAISEISYNTIVDSDIAKIAKERSAKKRTNRNSFTMSASKENNSYSYTMKYFDVDIVNYWKNIDCTKYPLSRETRDILLSLEKETETKSGTMNGVLSDFGYHFYLWKSSRLVSSALYTCYAKSGDLLMLNLWISSLKEQTTDEREQYIEDILKNSDYDSTTTEKYYHKYMYVHKDVVSYADKNELVYKYNKAIKTLSLLVPKYEKDCTLIERYKTTFRNCSVMHPWFSKAQKADIIRLHKEHKKDLATITECRVIVEDCITKAEHEKINLKTVRKTVRVKQEIPYDVNNYTEEKTQYGKDLELVKSYDDSDIVNDLRQCALLAFCELYKSNVVNEFSDFTKYSWYAFQKVNQEITNYRHEKNNVSTNETVETADDETMTNNLVDILLYRSKNPLVFQSFEDVETRDLYNSVSEFLYDYFKYYPVRGCKTEEIKDDTGKVTGKINKMIESFMLFKFYGIQEKEISSIFGKDERTIRRYIKRCLDVCKDNLSREMLGIDGENRKAMYVEKHSNEKHLHNIALNRDNMDSIRKDHEKSHLQKKLENHTMLSFDYSKIYTKTNGRIYSYGKRTTDGTIISYIVNE